jgi:hypothetical protein
VARLSGLTEEEILAIAEHEHLPEIAATALAQYLSKEEHGMEKIRDMIVDDIRQAQQRQAALREALHGRLKCHHRFLLRKYGKTRGTAACTWTLIWSKMHASVCREAAGRRLSS